MKKLRNRAQVAEVANVAARLITAFDTDTVADSTMQEIIANLRTKATALTEAIKRNRAISNLDELDTARDTAWIRLYHLLEGYTYIPNEAMQQAAIALTAITHKYGLAAAHVNYSTQSTLMESALADFAAEELANSIALLPGVSELITQLREAQDCFHTARVDFHRANAIDSTESSPTDLKKEVINIINQQLITRINALFIISPDSCNAFMQTASHIIDSTNTTVAKRVHNS